MLYTYIYIYTCINRERERGLSWWYCVIQAGLLAGLLLDRQVLGQHLADALVLRVPVLSMLIN